MKTLGEGIFIKIFDDHSLILRKYESALPTEYNVLQCSLICTETDVILNYESVNQTLRPLLKFLLGPNAYRQWSYV